MPKTKSMRAPNSGDVYSFKNYGERPIVSLTWVAIFIHPDDGNFFFCLPADSNCKYIGSSDVCVQIKGSGQRVLRGGAGHWFQTKDLLTFGVKIGRVSSKDTKRAHVTVACLISKMISGSSSDLKPTSDDGSQSYWRWIEKVQVAGGALLEFLDSTRRT